jgi:hypothetical protein
VIALDPETITMIQGVGFLVWGIRFVSVVFEYHVLGLRLLRLLLVGHFLRMMDRMRRFMSALRKYQQT